MKELLQKKSIKVTLFVLFVLIYITVNIIIYKHAFDNSRKNLYATPELNAGEIANFVTDDTTITQSFIVHDNNFAGVAVKFSTFSTPVNDEIYFSINEDGNPNPLIDWTASDFKIVNNGYYYFTFNPIQNSNGKKYTFTIRYKGVDPQNLIAPYYSSDSTEYPEGQLTVNGQKMDGVIAFKQLYGDSFSTGLFIRGVIIYTLACLILIFIAWKFRNNIVRVFFPTAMILGLLFMFTTPMFRGQDETLHFYRAYEVSLGYSVSDFSDGQGGRLLPASLEKITLPDVTEITYADTAKALNQKLEPEKVRFIDFPNSALYSPVVYYPQSFGIWLARALGFGPLVMAYFGRFFNLLVWAILMTLALQILFFGKRMLFLLALTPMSLFTVASLSCDGITNALSFLYISYVLYLTFGKEHRASPIQIAFLILLSIGISLAKIVYMPLCLICLIIPASKFGGIKKWIAMICVIIATSVAFNLAWLTQAMKFLVTNVVPGVNANMQIAYIIGHPLQFASNILYTLSQQLNFYVQSFFGGSLGWFDIPVHTWIVLVFTLALLFIAVCDNKYNVKFTINKKIMLFATFIVISLLIFASIYIQYNRVQSAVIDGIQGRYFMPIILLLLALFNNNKIKLEISEKTFNFSLAAGIILLQFPVLLTILLYHI